MSPSSLLTILLSIILIDFLFEQILDYINLKNQKGKLPEELQNIYDDEEYKKSHAYHRVQTNFSFLTSTFSIILSIIVFYSGFLGTIDLYIRQFVENEILISLTFFAVIFISSDIINTPIQWYNTFVIEERFGFNKTTPKVFFVDKIKGYMLAIIVGGIIIGTLLYLIQSLGGQFWLWFWFVISIFILFVNLFYTSLVIPLFNKLTPLEDGDLKSAIQAYSVKVNFPLDNIFVIDGSKRSTKANAFFSGIGKKKKIVLYDTLIKNHTVEELVAVLAHEVGHFKKRHIITSLILSVLQIGFMLYIMSWTIFNENLSIALGATTSVIHINILAFGILYTPISKFTSLFMNIMSRKNEFEADAYAAHTYDGKHLEEALKKLSVNNLSNLTPHPSYVFMHYSHPPLLQRLISLKKESRQ